MDLLRLKFLLHDLRWLNKDEDSRGMEEHAEPVGDVLHHGCGVGQDMEGGGSLDEEAGAAVLLAGKLVEAEGLESGGELRGKDHGLGGFIVVEIGIGRAAQENDGPEGFAGSQHRGDHGGMCLRFGEPEIGGDAGVVEEEGTAALNRVHGDGWRVGRTVRWGVGRDIRRYCGGQAETTKRLGEVAVGFGSDEVTVGGTTPKVSAAGMKEETGESAKRADELAGSGALKGGAGKFQKELVESLVRLRRGGVGRVIGVGRQWAPIAQLSG